MFELKTDAFILEFIDPDRDRSRLGPRYCWGGYVYQVYDLARRPLMSGPQFPDPHPIPFHGQGLPEVFRYWDKQKETPLNVRDGRGLIIGIGEVAGISGEEARLGALCRWERDTAPNRCEMRTEQSCEGWAYRLARAWTADGAMIRSATSVENRGEQPLDVHWYPHPFYPLVNGGMRFSVRPRVAVEPNPGFGCDPDGVFFMKSEHDWKKKGHFQWMSGTVIPPLSAEFEHPVTGAASMGGDFPVAYMPVWANACTISLEPHSLRRLAPGASADWTLEYRFGAP